MADPIALRRPVLEGGAVAAPAVVVTPLPPVARFVLRLAPEAAVAVGPLAGFDLGGALNTVTGTGDRLAARLGPDEWRLIAPVDAAGEIAAAIAAGLGETFHSLVDVSHRDAAIGLEGRGAVDALAAGTPLDLADAAFPPGSATRTVLGKTEIVLIRPLDGPLWRVEAARSLAPYVFAFLAEAAR